MSLAQGNKHTDPAEDPLQIWTLKICIHDNSKIITARSSKLGQLIEDDE